MSRPRLFPEPAETDSRAPQKKFEEVASNVFSVSKEELDKREAEWERERKENRKTKPQKRA